MAIHNIQRYVTNADDWTAAFAEASRACGIDNGGIIDVPAGSYQTGTIRLPSNTMLRLQAGATIRAHAEPGAFPLVEKAWEGRLTTAHEALIVAENAEHVSITGEGSIDGNGAIWWQAVRDKSPLGQIRPQLISFRNCRDVTVEGVRLCNSPSWTIHPWRCKRVRIAGITIQNPQDAPNTDGIDPESCDGVVISDCWIDVGDDGIVLKSGMREDGEPNDHPPCENVRITRCTIVHGHGGIVIGSEMSGGVRHVRVRDCVFMDTDRGIRIKTRRGRGGFVEDVKVVGLNMRNVGCPIAIYMYYRYTRLKPGDIPWVSSREAQPVDAGTPRIRGVHFEEIVAIDATGPCLAVLYGLPESPLQNITLRKCFLQQRTEPDPKMSEPAMMVHMKRGDYPTCGVFAADVCDLTLDQTVLVPRAGETMVSERVSMKA